LLIGASILLIVFAELPRSANNEYMKSTTTQTWNAEAYAANGRFVANMAGGVVELLAPVAGERILDIGCGDGALTERLAATGAVMVGVDVSEAMVAAARSRGLEVVLSEVAEMRFEGEFDAAFSNAALHWISVEKQAAALRAIQRTVRPGGRLVAEMGGFGNIAAIRVALQTVLARFGVDAEGLAASFFPSPGHYTGLLEDAGFRVEYIELIPRATPLPGGADGMNRWLNTFRNGVLDRLAEGDRVSALAETVGLLAPVLQDPVTGDWTADYVRLRFRAVRV
jgi:trans-aconitate methyltransferase